jgi:hypothetical protein
MAVNQTYKLTFGITRNSSSSNFGMACEENKPNRPLIRDNLLFGVSFVVQYAFFASISYSCPVCNGSWHFLAQIKFRVNAKGLTSLSLGLTYVIAPLIYLCDFKY